MADAAFWNLHVWEVPRKDRVFRGQNPLLMDYSDEQLRQRYRFGRDSIMYLSDLLRDKLERLTRPKTSLTVEEKVMIALRFFASGSHLQVGTFFGFSSLSSISTADDRKARCFAQLHFG